MKIVHMKTHRLQYWGSCILGEHVIKLFPNCLRLSKLHWNWQGRAPESKYKLEYLAMVGSWVSQKPLSIRYHKIPILKTALQWGKAHDNMAFFYTHILSLKSLVVHNGAGCLVDQKLLQAQLICTSFNRRKVTLYKYTYQSSTFNSILLHVFSHVSILNDGLPLLQDARLLHNLLLCHCCY